MEVVFVDPALALIETEDAAQTRLPVPIIKSARRKLTVLRAAPDERSLRNWKSLHYEKLKGDMQGHRSIRLNDQYRMVFSLEDSQGTLTLTVICIEDYH
jgi:proteic killer suppression protein